MVSRIVKFAAWWALVLCGFLLSASVDSQPDDEAILRQRDTAIAARAVPCSGCDLIAPVLAPAMFQNAAGGSKLLTPKRLLHQTPGKGQAPALASSNVPPLPRALFLLEPELSVRNGSALMPTRPGRAPPVQPL